MAYINTGDVLMLDGATPCIAAGENYVQLHYDAEAREMARHGLDYGVARGMVKIIVPSTSQQLTVEVSRVKKVVP